MCNACGIYYKTHGVHRPLGACCLLQGCSLAGFAGGLCMGIAADLLKAL